jgi:hypothetical protein
MSKRIRLTERLAMSKERLAESQKDGLFPGDVGNEERKKNYRKIDEYHTFEQTVNHELPDMRHDWQDNPRDEVGMGIPKTAKKTLVTATANATKLAYFLLGKKASDEMIEAQARDFLRLGSDRLEAAVERFAETVDLYEDEEEEEIEDDFEDDEDFEDDDCEDCEDEEVEASCEEAPVMAEEEPVMAEEAPAVVEEEPAVEEAPVMAEEEPVVEEEAPAEMTDEDVQVAPESVEDEAEEDVDFDFGEVEGMEEDNTPDELKAIFDEEEEVTASMPKTAKTKSVGSQPKIASALKADELSGLWDKESDVF